MSGWHKKQRKCKQINDLVNERKSQYLIGGDGLGYKDNNLLALSLTQICTPLLLSVIWLFIFGDKNCVYSWAHYTMEYICDF